MIFATIMVALMNEFKCEFLTWCSLGGIIGCFGWYGKKKPCFSLSPTWRSSFLINACSGKTLLSFCVRFVLSESGLWKICLATPFQEQNICFSLNYLKIFWFDMYFDFTVLIITNVLRSWKKSFNCNEFIIIPILFRKNKTAALYFD